MVVVDVIARFIPKNTFVWVYVSHSLEKLAILTEHNFLLTCLRNDLSRNKAWAGNNHIYCKVYGVIKFSSLYIYFLFSINVNLEQK